jgi:hypothetical protein
LFLVSFRCHHDHRGDMGEYRPSGGDSQPEKGKKKKNFALASRI